MYRLCLYTYICIESVVAGYQVHVYRHNKPRSWYTRACERKRVKTQGTATTTATSHRGSSVARHCDHRTHTHAHIMTTCRRIIVRKMDGETVWYVRKEQGTPHTMFKTMIDDI